jgi:ribonuclease HI
MIVEVAFDGGCRNNPNGPASSGAIVRDPDGRTLRHIGLAIGIASNNVAEWTGLLIGLEAAREVGATAVRAFGDSQLVVEQFTGNYAIRDEKLRTIAMEVSTVARSFPGGVTAAHVPREKNRAADAICRAVLEGTYTPDSDVDVYTAGDVEVHFVVAVRMDHRAVSEAIEAGATPAALRKKLAAQVESKLIRTGVVGEYSVIPSRIKG